MNATDREMMVRDYDRAWDAAHRTFEQSIIALQDDAYNMGFERGANAFNKMVKALENASCQLLSAGYQAASDEIDRLLDEVT